MSNLLRLGVGRNRFPASLSYQTSLQDNVNRSTYTWTSVPIGTAAADRYVLCFCCHGASSQSTITVDGISGTNIFTPADTTMKWWLTPVPTGTSVTIVQDGGSAIVAFMAVWAVYGLISSTPFHTGDTGSLTTATSGNFNINIAENGVVAAVRASAVGDSGNTTWTNATKRSDLAAGDVELRCSPADYTATSAETPRNISFTQASSAAFMSAFGVSLR